MRRRSNGGLQTGISRKTRDALSVHHCHPTTDSDVTLHPIPVTNATAAALPVPSDADRGERLFVAKGCTTCHVQLDVGPRLDGKRFDPAYLARFLAAPERVAPSGRNGFAMPNLGLRQREIASLVAYLNDSRQVGLR